MGVTPCIYTVATDGVTLVPAFLQTGAGVQLENCATEPNQPPPPVGILYHHDFRTQGDVLWTQMFQNNATTDATDGRRVTITSGDRWGDNHRLRWWDAPGASSANNAGIGTRQEVYQSFRFRMPANGMGANADNTGYDTKFGFGLFGLNPNKAENLVADGDNKLGAGDTWSLRVQGRAERNSASFYGEQPTGGPFAELYIYAYHAFGTLWTNNTRTSNWAIHRTINLNGATWNPVAGVEYKITLHAKMNDPGQNNGIARVYIDGVLGCEATDVRFTEADDIPIDGTTCATFTNGGSQNEVWRFPEFWVHEHLGDEPGGS